MGISHVIFSAQVTITFGSLSSHWYGPTFCTSGRRTIFREFCSRLGGHFEFEKLVGSGFFVCVLLV